MVMTLRQLNQYDINTIYLLLLFRWDCKKSQACK